MKLIDLVESANAVTDESLDFDLGVKFINDCISKINIECDTIYPIYSDTDENTEMPIPEKWQIALVVPFVSAKIKQIDASKFEFDEFFSEFQINLNSFKAKYNIPDEYKDADSGSSFAPDFTGNPNVGGWTGNGTSNDPFSV